MLNIQTFGQKTCFKTFILIFVGKKNYVLNKNYGMLNLKEEVNFEDY